MKIRINVFLSDLMYEPSFNLLLNQDLTHFQSASPLICPRGHSQYFSKKIPPGPKSIFPHKPPL